MANKDAAFGFRPIGKVGQNRDSQGLSEYNIAANSSAIYQNDLVAHLDTGYIGVSQGTTAAAHLLGSLNGVFYTDASTSKPTWANHLAASNTATDIVGFVSDDPYERFEAQSASSLVIADIGLNAPINTYAAGSSANFVSKQEVNTATASMDTTNTLPIRVIGVAKDIENSELLNATTYSTNVNVVCKINTHFMTNTTGI
jgi:hypothetical protein